MSSTEITDEQGDLPPLARAHRELHRLNHTMPAVEQALAEAGELTDQQALAILLTAEATRGRLEALIDRIRATNPTGTQWFEHRMQEAAR